MLTITNFDEAMVEYFQGFFENTIYGNPSNAFKNAAMKSGDKVKLPLISVYRSNLELASLRNFTLFKRGQILSVDPHKVTRERILPLVLTYQADIWATELQQATQLFCEVLFRTLDKPTIEVFFDGRQDKVSKNLILQEIADNTDISQISSRGRLNRFTITYQMEGYIAKVVENDRINIVPEFYSFDGKELK